MAGDLADVNTTQLKARLGAPVGATISADVAAVKAETALIQAKTTNLPASPAAQAKLDTLHDTRIPGVVQPQTGDSYARLGAPVGASHSADVVAVKAETALIKAKTDNLPATPASQGDVTSARDVLAAYIDTEVAAIKAKTDAFADPTRLDAAVTSRAAATDVALRARQSWSVHQGYFGPANNHNFPNGNGPTGFTTAISASGAGMVGRITLNSSNWNDWRVKITIDGVSRYYTYTQQGSTAYLAATFDGGPTSDSGSNAGFTTGAASIAFAYTSSFSIEYRVGSAANPVNLDINVYYV